MNVFARAETAKGFLPRSSENLSHSHFYTSDFGELKINYLQKVYPSDKIRLTCTNYIRTIPLTTPLNADIQSYQRFYFVPFRILWSHFPEFIFGGEDGDYTAIEPYIVNGERSTGTDYDDMSTWDFVADVNSVADDMRFPVGKRLRFNSENPRLSTHVNAYPFAGYQCIYKEFYRNENIQTRGSYSSDPVFDYDNEKPANKMEDHYYDYGLWHDVNRVGVLDDGPNAYLKVRDDAKNPQWHIALDRRRYANFELDYFTSLNPWQQRGDSSAISVARDTEFSADVLAKLLDNVRLASISSRTATMDSGVFRPYFGAYELSDGVEYGDAGNAVEFSGSIPFRGLGFKSDTTVRQTLEGTISMPDATISISDLRLAEQLQIMRELSARGGERFNEGLTAFFHVSPTNLELDRPQYLGGFVQTINVSDIWQTSATSNTPLGTLAGKGSSLGKNGFGSYLCKEHGFIIGIQHIMPKAMYSDGLDREWNTNSRYDWWWPQFSGLSEQAVYGKELQTIDAYYADSDSSTFAYNAEILGYQGRGNELRARTSYVTGGFRDWGNASGSGRYYGAWSLARHFADANPPRISDAFLSGRNVQKNGAFAVEDGMQPFQIQSYFKVRMVRPVTKRARPIV